MSLFHVKFNSALIIQYSGNHNNYFVNKYNYSMQLHIMKKELNFVQKKNMQQNGALAASLLSQELLNRE